MRELAICHGIIDVARAALGKLPPPPRASLTVRIGRLTAVVRDSLHYWFRLLTPGTVLQGPTLG